MIYLILSGLACYKWVKVSQLCCSLEALRPACCKVAYENSFCEWSNNDLLRRGLSNNTIDFENDEDYQDRDASCKDNAKVGPVRMRLFALQPQKDSKWHLMHLSGFVLLWISCGNVLRLADLGLILATSILGMLLLSVEQAPLALEVSVEPRNSFLSPPSGLGTPSRSHNSMAGCFVKRLRFTSCCDLLAIYPHASPTSVIQFAPRENSFPRGEASYLFGS